MVGFMRSMAVIGIAIAGIGGARAADRPAPIGPAVRAIDAAAISGIRSEARIAPHIAAGGGIRIAVMQAAIPSPPGGII